ncbi:MAG: hypothetical protein K2L26_09270, partial [Duncaniella sp.]|nr:hypothetical protein [Duncaniella sp.]
MRLAAEKAAESGILTPAATGAEAVSVRYVDLLGRPAARKGLVIEIATMSDGSVRTAKRIF